MGKKRTPDWYKSEDTAANRLAAAWEEMTTGLPPIFEFELAQPAHRLTKTGRKPKPWRFDMAWPMYRLLVEIDGHGAGHGYAQNRARDAQKQRDAISEGYTVVRFTTTCLGSYEKVLDAVTYLQERLASSYEPPDQRSAVWPITVRYPAMGS